MCTSTRFPEAIPLKSITAPKIVKALTKFFTYFGLPKSIQSDQGSNFMSGLFQQVMHTLGIDQFKSSAYHPESQGALERFHQTLKTMMKAYCLENQKDWDEGIHFLLFAVRESVQESIGFSPFELVFGHMVRGPLKLLKETWLEENSSLNLLDYVSSFKNRLLKATEMAKENLKGSQAKMKVWYDKKVRQREFKPGDKVLVLLPISGHPLRARYYGPCTIESKLSEENYLVKTPNRRRQTQLCHINMLKPYYDRDSKTTVEKVNLAFETESRDTLENVDIDKGKQDNLGCLKSKNSSILDNLDQKLNHLDSEKKDEVAKLILEYRHLFPDIPGRTDVLFHDVDVGEAKPIKQPPYRLNPIKKEHMQKEIDYVFKHDIIERSDSEWSSPCILVPKPDKTYRFCTDYRKINAVTKTDSYPIPRIDDCIDRVGQAKYVTKFDLLKGYWQVPLTERAKKISAFATPDGLFQYKVMPFGMKNAPATFQRLISNLIRDLPKCEGYIDDIIIYSDTWKEHMHQLQEFLEKLSQAKLTANLVKSEFGKATVTYLGHVVGQGHVRPIQAKVEAIAGFPVPTSRKELMRFIGMTGYYRKFCPNFSDVTAPLTSLLSKKVKFTWSENCQRSFEKVKMLLQSAPVLIAPDFNKPFKLTVDASDLGAGAVLMQEHSGIDHPICYFSKKFLKHQKNYSTIEKETLVLMP